MDIYFQSGKHIVVLTEILAHCFSYLSPKDIKSTRLACKQFYHSSSRYLIHKVFAGCQTETLDRLEEISKHNQFRNHVTTVVYSAYPLAHDYATVDEYHERFSALAMEIGTPIPTKEQCIPYWCKYRELFADQVKFEQNDNEKTRIVNALKRMQNIRHLELSDVAWRSPAHPLCLHWLTGQNILLTPHCDRDSGPFQISHGFEVMVAAFAECGIRSETFIQTTKSCASDVLKSPCFIGNSQIFFGYLRTIELFFTDSNIACQDEAEECLALVEDLRYLTLEVEADPAPNRQIFFANVFTNTWPNIHSIYLTMNLDYDLFSAFCQRHQESIRFVSLRRAYVLGGTWARLAEAMRSCLRLTDAFLEDLGEESMPNHSWEFGRRLPQAEHYLVHGGDNPFSNDVLKLLD